MSGKEKEHPFISFIQRHEKYQDFLTHLEKVPYDWKSVLIDTLDTAETVSMWCKAHDMPLSMVPDLTQVALNEKAARKARDEEE